MNKKISISLVGILFISLFVLGAIPSSANEEEHVHGSTYAFGAFLLTARNVDGIPENEHMGGLGDLDFTATSTEFMIYTVPFWGTTIIDEETDIHIHMDNFFGLISTYSDGTVEIMGLCKNIGWELQ
jgi:hypothetical protein